MREHSLSALIAAGLLSCALSTASASAADLAANCCADLEERVAELEATTARKGNRRVRLTVSGGATESAARSSNAHVRRTHFASPSMSNERLPRARRR
jgi:hypothetical protein